MIKIYGTNGKLYKEITYNNEDIDISKLSSGVYLIQCTNEKEDINTSEKFIIN